MAISTKTNSVDNNLRGTVSLNNPGMLSYILSPQWDPAGNTVEHSVFWGAKNGLWSRVERHESVEMSHLTIREIDEGYGLRGEYVNSVAAANNILCGIGMDSGDYAMLTRKRV